MMTEAFHEPAILHVSGDDETLAEVAIVSGKLVVDVVRNLAFMPDTLLLEAIANGDYHVDGRQLIRTDGRRVDVYALDQDRMP